MIDKPFTIAVGSALRRILQGRQEHLEAFAAAYLSMTDIPPEEAVLVEQHEGNMWRWWFERRASKSDE